MATATWAWVVVGLLVLGGVIAWHKARKSKGGSGRAVGPDQGDSRRQK